MDTNNTNTITLESQPANAVAARSTPKVIDYSAIVYECASVSTKYGRQFNGRKGKQKLFGLTCDTVKSMRGLGDEQNLDSDELTGIRHAITAFWQGRATELLSDYEITSCNYDKPKLRLSEDGKSLVPVEIHASIKGIRAAKDVLEEHVKTREGLELAKKRQQWMETNPSKCDASDVRKIARIIELGELKLAALEATFKVNNPK